MITQIYEIQERREALRCIALGVDRVGSVLESREGWKQETIREVVRATQAAGRRHSLIPLFGGLTDLARALDFYRPDIVHFCDALTDAAGKVLPLDALGELQLRIRERFPGIEIMRSIPVPALPAPEGFPTLEIARALAPATDCFLIDTWIGTDAGDGFFGITGRTVDWGLSARLVAQSTVPVVLAGGLSPENVFEAILAVRPAGVDSCTQTNAVDEAGRPMRFRKDFEKVKRFVSEALRAAESIRRPPGAA